MRLTAILWRSYVTAIIAEAWCSVAVELWCELWGQRRGIGVYPVSVGTAAGRQYNAVMF